LGQLDEGSKGLLGRLVDKNARVEAVGPADIRRGRKVRAVKQLVHIASERNTKKKRKRKKERK
jgi:hypothetical protein